MKTLGKTALYRLRFPECEAAGRRVMWNVLYKRVFGAYIRAGDTVMDIGAGQCEFINAAACRRRIAVDVNPDTARRADRGVEVLKHSGENIPGRYDGSVDVVFMSNILEHLPDKDAILRLLVRTHTLLMPQGRLIVVSPNIDLVKERYWDFWDHITPLNGKSLTEALGLSRFCVERYVKRFLPYTTKSVFPIHPLFMHLYLSLPPVFRPFAGQSLFVCRKLPHKR